jgi:hypothetical protein
MNTKFPDIILERYVLGELPEEKRRAIEAELSSNKILRARIEMIGTSNAEILGRYTPSSFIQSMEKITRSQTVPRGRLALFKRHLPALGAAAAAIIIVFMFPFTVQHPTINVLTTDPGKQNGVVRNDVIRLKGDESKLFIFRKTDSDPELLANDAVTHEGDVIQLAFQSVKQYGIILSIDGGGNVTLHYPASPWDSAKIEKGKKTYLKRSYQLDNAPQYEKFFFITSDVGVNVDYVLSKARALAKDPGKTAFDQLSIAGTKELSILLRKE